MTLPHRAAFYGLPVGVLAALCLMNAVQGKNGYDAGLKHEQSVAAQCTVCQTDRSPGSLNPLDVSRTCLQLQRSGTEDRRCDLQPAEQLSRPVDGISPEGRATAAGLCPRCEQGHLAA